MIPAVLAALMAAAAVACVLPWRRGRNMTVATAATFMALAFVCTVPAVYAALDRVLGRVDAADLVKNSLFVVAVTFLARAVVMASGVRYRARTTWWLFPIGVIGLQTVAFAFVAGRHGPSDFMTTYGDQPAAAVYSIAHFGYFGLTFVAATVACVASGYASAGRPVRIAIGTLLTGSVVSVCTAALLVTRDLIRVGGHVDTASALNRAYQPMLVLSVLLVAAGLAMPPLLAGIARRRLQRELPTMTDGLVAVRDRLADGDASLRLPDGLRVPGSEPTAVDRVHRLVVEVRDQLFLHPDAVLTDGERLLLERSEALLDATDLA